MGRPEDECTLESWRGPGVLLIGGERHPLTVAGDQTARLAVDGRDRHRVWLRTGNEERLQVLRNGPMGVKFIAWEDERVGISE